MTAKLTATIAIGTTALVLTAAGCASQSSPTSSTQVSSPTASSSSAPTSAAQEADYSRLLITSADIAAPGDTFTAQEPTINPGGKPGVATVFSNADDTHEIGVTIFVLPDAAAADISLQGAIAAFGASVVGGTPQPVQVGTNASMVSGTSPDGTKSITVLVFTQGRAFTTLEFDSGPQDPVPAEAVLDVARKQDLKLKTDLGG